MNNIHETIFKYRLKMIRAVALRDLVRRRWNDAYNYDPEVYDGRGNELRRIWLVKCEKVREVERKFILEVEKLYLSQD